MQVINSRNRISKVLRKGCDIADKVSAFEVYSFWFVDKQKEAIEKPTVLDYRLLE